MLTPAAATRLWPIDFHQKGNAPAPLPAGLGAGGAGFLFFPRRTLPRTKSTWRCPDRRRGPPQSPGRVRPSGLPASRRHRPQRIQQLIDMGYEMKDVGDYNMAVGGIAAIYLDKESGISFLVEINRPEPCSRGGGQRRHRTCRSPCPGRWRRFRPRPCCYLLLFVLLVVVAAASVFFKSRMSMVTPIIFAACAVVTLVAPHQSGAARC